MKSKAFSPTTRLLMAFSAATLGSIAILFATPQMEPEGDIEVAELIQIEIYHDAKMGGAEVKVSINGGIATLTGTAYSLSQVERATKKLFSNPSVQTVVNRIDIVPGNPSKITTKADELLAKQKLLDARKVSTCSEGSCLILKGTVSTSDEAELAREIVSAIHGVTAVETRLTVDFQNPRTDLQIAHQLSFIVQEDPVYTELDLVPTVIGGVVSWDGEVGSRSEFDRLVRHSYVTGVIQVVTSKLKVNGDLIMETTEDKIYSPTQCMEAFNVAMAHNPRIDSSTILAGISDGVISLKGTIDTAELSDAVERTARVIPGVLGVDNHLNGWRNKPYRIQ